MSASPDGGSAGTEPEVTDSPENSHGAVVVGIDGAGSALRAAVWAGGEASRRGSPLRLVHCFSVPRVGMRGLVGSVGRIRAGMAAQGDEWLGAARSAVLARYPDLPVEVLARESIPVSALVRETEHAGLLVLGSRGLGGFSGLLVGSTAVALAARSRCPSSSPAPRMPLTRCR